MNDFPSSSFEAIVELCRNSDNLPESELLEKIDVTLLECPEAAHERDEYGYTLLHVAAVYRPLEFCRRLIDLNPDAIKSKNREGMLPLHCACQCNYVETVRYLFEMYPESIHVFDSQRNYPIDFLLFNDDEGDSLLELARFLLQHDEGAVTKCDIYGNMSLHYAVEFESTVNIVKLVYNAYPQAIYMENNEGTTALSRARYFESHVAVSFLEAQLEFVRQATEDLVPDDTGRLPLHRAILRRDVPVGTIKLMIAANPISVRATDAKGMSPLHFASEIDDLDVIKCLIEQCKEALEIQDLGGNLPLHHACSVGLYDVVNCILDESEYGVSIRNTDGKLPIHLFIYDDECDRNSSDYFGRVDHFLIRKERKNAVHSLEYVDTFYRLLRVYPAIHEIFVDGE